MELQLKFNVDFIESMKTTEKCWWNTKQKSQQTI